MADDLDDEWWLEGKSSADIDPPADEHQTEQKESHRKSKKRKASDSVGEVHDEQKDDVQKPDLEDPAQPRKKKKKKRKKNISDMLASQKAVPPTPSDLITAIKKHFEGKLSTVEWDEFHINEGQFSLCNDLSHTPNSFLKTCLPKWKKLLSGVDKRPGSPLLLVITSAAIRAAQLNREIAVFKGEECKVAKLFAKHMKVNEQIKFLQKQVIHLGVGTPNRICALLDSGSLHLDQVTRVVIDWTWRDIKQRRLVDMTEVKEDLFKLLHKHVLSYTKQGSCKIALM